MTDISNSRQSPRGRPPGGCHPEAWSAWKANYLRAERPTAEESVRIVLRLAEARGWDCPRYAKYYTRRLRREVSPQAVTLARRGPEALDRMRPSQIRDREALASMEVVCADGHRWDVSVEWPDGAVARPVMVAWQDIRSARPLGWRIGPAETSDLYRLSAADMLWRYGAPGAVIVDNGRGIAAKCLTGGTPNRYRGKVLDEDPTGLLTELVGPENIHWTKPYSGQSKPIERAFRDFASDIAKDPRLAGAYCGRDTVSKPHNHGERAVPLETFRAVVADGIARHSSRPGRRGLGMRGRSCEEAFEAELGEPRMLEPAQLARWLLAMRSVTARAGDGSVAVFGARYWSEGLAGALAMRPKGQRQVIVRFDPERLDRPVLVERPDGRPIALAEPQGRVPFLAAEAARTHERAKARSRRAAREELAAALELDAAAVGGMLDELAAPAAALPDLIEFPEPDPGLAEDEELIRAGDEYTLALAFGGGDR